MKKIILMLMIIIGCFSFAEKLHTNKQLNWEKIEGKWFNGFYEFKTQKGNKFLITNDVNGRSVQKLKINGYIIVDNYGGKYAYDTKYNTVVALSDNQDILIKFNKKYIPAN